MANDDHPDLDRVIPLTDWFRRIGLPTRSGRRLIASGAGPVITELTERRRGVRERDHVLGLRRAASPTPPNKTARTRSASSASSAGPNFRVGPVTTARSTPAY